MTESPTHDYLVATTKGQVHPRIPRGGDYGSVPVDQNSTVDLGMQILNGLYDVTDADVCDAGRGRLCLVPRMMLVGRRSLGRHYSLDSTV